MSKAAPAFPVVLIMIIVLAAVYIAVVPSFPQVTGAFRIQSAEPKVALLSAKMDKLTLSQASSIDKGKLFLYPISAETGPTVNLSVEVYYSGQSVAAGAWYQLPSGLYSFSVVFSTIVEHPGAYYALKLTATFPDGQVIVVEGIVPPG